jgi:hypothetical protein
MKSLLCSLLLVFSSSLHAQEIQTDTLRVLSYNLLKFPDVSPNRIDTLKSILAYVKPDIFMACELTSGAGANDILFNALNEDGVSHYDMADYVPGPDTENALYFNSDKLALAEQNVIPTDLRDINEYVLYYKSDDLETTGDTVFFYVFVCHLKASSGFEAQRNGQAIALKTYINTRGYSENIIIGGDFNFYGSDTEPAWNTILTGGGVTIKDPITAPGHWHADPGFAWLHTQSTRSEAFDGGAFGGMDDRFDFIFIGEDLKTYANDARYIDGSYRAIGQDGYHYNKSLVEEPTNTSEPSEIIWNLYHMSDHLPVYMEIEVVKIAASVDETAFEPSIFYNDLQDELTLKAWPTEEGAILVVEIYDLNGRVVLTQDWQEGSTLSTASLSKGTYLLKMKGFGGAFKFVKS